MPDELFMHQHLQKWNCHVLIHWRGMNTGF